MTTDISSRLIANKSTVLEHAVVQPIVESIRLSVSQ